MTLSRKEFVQELEAWAALDLAEPWDNVGLLVDPGPGQVNKVLLTIDLSAAVYEEARAWGADFIIAYHPPIFAGLKRLAPGNSAPGIAVKALMDNLPVYSPHTALDVAPGRMGDWLAQALGVGTTVPIDGTVSDSIGVGKIVVLETPISLAEAVKRLKKHLGLTQVRLAEPGSGSAEAMINKVAFCPGAGGSVFEKVTYADLLVTGEMRHHDVLNRVGNGQAVILCDHTNTERGYLPLLAREIQKLCPSVAMKVSSFDRDPLEIV